MSNVELEPKPKKSFWGNLGMFLGTTGILSIALVLTKGVSETFKQAHNNEQTAMAWGTAFLAFCCWITVYFIGLFVKWEIEESHAKEKK